jgi:L-glutamine-phosphate cytidylyltransferase
MKAIILAAGRGNRLLPHTDRMPKCMLKVGSKTILEHQLDILESCKIKKIFIVIGHKGEKVVRLAGNRAACIENRDYLTTNSSYSLWLARKYLKGAFIYLNSDLLFHPSLLKKLLESRHENAMIVDASRKSRNDMFKAVIKNNKIIKLRKDLALDVIQGEAPGPVKLSPQFAAKVFKKIQGYVKSGNKRQFCQSVFGKVAAAEPLYAIDADGLYWVEIDYLKDLRKARERAKKYFL